jgi:large subunit ribosomal protein L10
MTKEEKNQEIEVIMEKLKATPHFYIADVSGLDAEGTTKLRRLAFKSEIGLTVMKNSLIVKAMDKIEGVDYTELYDSLVGPTALMFSEVGNAPAKLIKEFRKKSEKPLLKAAFVEQAAYVGDDQLSILAEIKSKDELIGEIIGLLQSPVKNVMGALQSGSNTLTGILKTLETRA